MPTKNKIAEEITNGFITQIEQWQANPDVRPSWTAGWVSLGGGGLPIRADGTPYRGINVLWLSMIAMREGYTSNQWFGYSAAKDAAAAYARSQGRNIESRDRKRREGTYYWDVDNDCLFEGGVRKGETASRVVFVKRIQVEDKGKVDENGDPKKKVVPLMRYLSVFNRDQIEGLPPVASPDVPTFDFDPLERAEEIVSGFDLPLIEGGDSAFYMPSRDEIHMPTKAQFKSSAEWYSTAFHEMGHATGHSSRLDRNLRNGFGSKEYAFEELVAELTSAFVCAETKVEGNVQHVEYLAHWLKVLGDDSGFIIRAASKAQAAADYILQREPIEYAQAA